MAQLSGDGAWWWAQRVLCVKVEELVGTVDELSLTDPSIRFYLHDKGNSGVGVKMSEVPLAAPPEELLGDFLHRSVEAFTEMRQLRWSRQPQCCPAFHAFSVVEVGTGDLFILLEKKSDKLELMLGKGPAAHSFMQEVRATGDPRNKHRCRAQPRRKVSSDITVRRLLEWLDRLLSRRWQPYNLFAANCQHFTGELHGFLADPAAAELDLVRRDARELLCVPDELREDREFVLAAVRQNWQALRYAPAALQQDHEVALAAVDQDANALRDADLTLRKDREVALVAVQRSGYALQHVDAQLQQDREVVLAAVRQTGYALRFAAEDLRRDREIALAAVRQNGYALQYVADELRESWNVALAAVHQNGHALVFAAAELRQDREVVLAAVRRNGTALQHVADELRGDRGVVWAAVAQNGSALQYAAGELMYDWGILLTAGWQDPLALRHVSGTCPCSTVTLPTKEVA